MRYFFRVEYDGSHYGGWQRQNNAISIQEKLETAFGTALRRECRITGAGRTDAGVHALRQNAHIDCPEVIDTGKCEQSVNALLPPDIAIYELRSVEDSLHARFSATARRYRYAICQRKRPLLYKRVWMVFYEVNWDLVRQNLAHLPGRHDFAAFCASGSGSDNTFCDVAGASLDCHDDLWVITIEADRFIYKMVRSVVGTLVDIGRGALNDSLDTIIASRDRRRVGSTAPPFGLVLENVYYPGENG